MSEGARFCFSMVDGQLEISGSELFVSQQVEHFREAILDLLKTSASSPVVVRQISTSQTDRDYKAEEASTEAFDGVKNPYPFVLDVMNDKLKITKSIKGSTISEKAVKLVLVYLWGKEKLLGQPTAEYKELRDLCEQHACLDSSNFSSTLASKKDLVVVDGSKGSSAKVCKLTYPGRDKAEAYLKEMNEV